MIAHICVHIIMLYHVYLPVLCVVYACVYLSIIVRTLVYSHYLHVFSTDHVVVTSALRLLLLTTGTLILPCLSYFSFTVMIAIKSYKANTAWVKRKHSEHLLFFPKIKSPVLHPLCVQLSRCDTLRDGAISTSYSIHNGYHLRCVLNIGTYDILCACTLVRFRHT